jgi:hypothetical protein
MNITAAVIIVIFAAVLFAEFMIRKQVSGNISKLTSDLVRRDFDAFDTDMDVLKNRIPAYTKAVLQFQKARLTEDTEPADRIFDEICMVGKKPHEIVSFFPETMLYYIERNDRGRALKCLDEIRKAGRSSITEDAERTYRILMEKKTDDLPQLLAEYEKAEENRKRIFAYLISACYENAGNPEKAKQYRRKAEDS